MNDPRRDHEMFSFDQPPSFRAISHVELARQDTKRFLGSKVDMGGSLVARIRVKIPPLDHEVRHGSGLYGMTPHHGCRPNRSGRSS
jgi:hypothetical protein